MRLYTMGEVARECHVTRSTVHYWLHTGKLQNVQKAGRMYVIDEDELARLKQTRTVLAQQFTEE